MPPIRRLGVLLLHLAALYFTALCLAVLPLAARAQGWSPRPAVTLEAAWTADAITNARGGERTGTALLHSADLLATLQPGHMSLWPHAWTGLTLFAHGIRLDGDGPTRLVGDLQGTSNIEAPAGWVLYEAWAEQVLLRGRLSVLGGKYAVDSEFDVLQTAALFVHSSHGTGPDFSQSGVSGPSIFPETLWGMRARFVASPTVAVQAAVLDASVGRVLSVVEASWFSHGTGRERIRRRLASRTTGVPLTARLAVGAWHWSGRGAVNAGVVNTGVANRGLWVLGETRVPGRERLSVFARIGLADKSANRITAYSGGGLVLSGPFRHRPADAVGLAVAVAHEGRGGRETNIETTYRAHVSPRVSLQAHLQFIANPNASAHVPNALVAGLRILAAL